MTVQLTKTPRTYFIAYETGGWVTGSFRRPGFQPHPEILEILPADPDPVIADNQWEQMGEDVDDCQSPVYCRKITAVSLGHAAATLRRDVTADLEYERFRRITEVYHRPELALPGILRAHRRR